MSTPMPTLAAKARIHRLAAAALVAVAALALSSAPAALAVDPDAAPSALHGVPLAGDAAPSNGFALPGLDAGTAAVPNAVPDAAAPDAHPAYDVRPTRVWTTDRFGYRRSTFYRGEVIAFWVQLYNPNPTYARHALELWADDLIRCITYPCDGGPQRLFAGTVTVRPGLTRYYLLARAERTDKVGEWSYYATDPQGETHLATRFFLR